MKYTKYIIGSFLAGLMLAYGIVARATTLQGFQGGTGYSTTTSANMGNFLQVASTSPYLTYTFGTSTGGTGTLSGNGTSTQIAFYTALQTLSSSLNLFWDNVNSRLGIGTSTPSYTLDVSGRLNVSATTTIGGQVVAGTGYTPYPEYTFGPDQNTGIDSTAPDIMNLVNGGINTMTLTSTNRVGIGTSTPATKLVVNGDITQTTLGTGLVKSTAGVLGNATSGTDYQAPISFPIPVASTSLAVSATSGLALNANTLYYNGVTSTVAGTNITQSCNGGTCTINTTTTPTFGSVTYSGDSTKTSTGYKDFSVNVLNTSSTTPVGASSTIQKLYFNAMTLTLISCSTDGSSITLQSDYRASSTPQTYGTSTFTGLVCSSTGASTTTFSNASIPAGSVLNFWPSSVPNSTTTLRIFGRAKET